MFSKMPFTFDVESPGANTRIVTRPLNSSPAREYVVEGRLNIDHIRKFQDMAIDGTDVIAYDLGLSDILGQWEEIVSVGRTDDFPNVRPDTTEMMVALGCVDAQQWSRLPASDDEEYMGELDVAVGM
jgi:hypothetical protein